MGDSGVGHEVRSDELELQARVLRIWEPKLVVLTDDVIQFFRPANPATRTQPKLLFELPCDKILVRPFPRLYSFFFLRLFSRNSVYVSTCTQLHKTNCGTKLSENILLLSLHEASYFFQLICVHFT